MNDVKKYFDDQVQKKVDPLSTKTVYNYMATIQRYAKKVPEDDFVQIAKKVFDELVAIEKATTRLLYLQAFLKVLTDMPGINQPALMEKYKKAFLDARNERDHDRGTEIQVPVEAFSSILKRIKDKYGEASEEYLLVSIYEEAPKRDDFNDVSIYDEKPITPVEKYIDLEKGELHMSVYTKTSKRHGAFNKILSKAFMDLLKRHLASRPVELRTTFLTQPSRRLFTRMGFGSQVLRRSLVSEVKPEDFAGSQKLAQSMGHGMSTQLTYHRPIGGVRCECEDGTTIVK